MTPRANTRLLIVGHPGGEHVGRHFLDAARALGIEARLSDLRAAWRVPSLIARICWHLPGRRPPRLAAYTRAVLAECRAFQPAIVLATGVAPLADWGLRALRQEGRRCLNFLTDDPWNPANGARFFMDALRAYDAVYSPRAANLDDLRAAGCAQARYLPFAYNPEVHFPEAPRTPEEAARFACDAVIVGGADRDRLPLARALAGAGLNVRLYGGYWDRYADLKACWRGFVHGRDLRLAVGCAGVNICMVRRANRDGHAMRTYEAPAMGGCVLAEDTADHRRLFGADPAWPCFRDAAELPGLVRAALAAPERRAAAQARMTGAVCNGGNRYQDRLAAMMDDRMIA